MPSEDVLSDVGRGITIWSAVALIVALVTLGCGGSDERESGYARVAGESTTTTAPTPTRHERLVKRINRACDRHLSWVTDVDFELATKREYSRLSTAVLDWVEAHIFAVSYISPSRRDRTALARMKRALSPVSLSATYAEGLTYPYQADLGADINADLEEFSNLAELYGFNRCIVF